VRRQIDAGPPGVRGLPIIEESEKVDLRAATAMAEQLQRDVFPGHRVGLPCTAG